MPDIINYFSSQNNKSAKKPSIWLFFNLFCYNSKSGKRPSPEEAGLSRKIADYRYSDSRLFLNQQELAVLKQASD